MIRTTRLPKIKDVIPLTNGVFGHMNYTFPETISITKEQLDFLFMSSFARRNPAPVIDLLHDSEEGETDFSQLTDAELTKLASMMLAYYKPKWDKLGEIYAIEYDPIHNYLDEWEDEADGTLDRDSTIDRDSTDTLNTTVTRSNTRTDNLSELETRALTNSNTRTNNTTDATTYGKTNTRTDNLSEGTTYGRRDTRTDNLSEGTLYGKTDTRTDNLTKTNRGEDSTINSGTDTNSVWGFNSSNAVNSDSTTAGTTSRHRIGTDQGDNPLTETNTGTQTSALSGTDTTTKTGTQTNVLSGTDTINKTGTQADALSGSDSTSHTGTIGDSGTEGGTITTANTGTQSSTGSDATTGTNSRAVDESASTDESTHRERSGRHFGNIGNLTSQTMIKEEIELWKWNYIQSILEDARDFLTLPMYL